MRGRRIPMPSPAMLVALAALFVALGGTGIAAGTLLSGSKIKKGSIPGNRLKAKSIDGSRLADDTVTGRQVKESTLGKVPAAALADTAGSAGTATRATTADTAAKATTADTAAKATTADSAKNAASADSVDGMDLSSFDVSLSNGAVEQTVLNAFDGLTIKASCTTGANNGLTILAQSASGDATISWAVFSRGSTTGNNAYTSMGTSLLTLTTPSDPTTPTGNGASDVAYSTGTMEYAGDAGGRVGVTWAYTNPANSCRFHGVAVGHPPGPGTQARGGAAAPAAPVSQARRAGR